MATTAFYQDWTFWSFAIATLALAASQAPPLRQLLKRASLEVEVYSRVILEHVVGNSHAQLHLIIRNNGGREIKVKGIELTFECDGRVVQSLRAQGYFDRPNDKEALLLTTFALEPESEWGHIVNFFNPLSRSDERSFRQLESNLRADIARKREALEDKNTNVAADEANVQPLLELFNQRFAWTPGEYTVTLKVVTSPEARLPSRRYRAVIFESDTAELKERTDGYKYGFGVMFPAHNQGGVVIGLKE